jgi:hypothetical protein
MAVILELAENANTYQPLGPRDARVVDPAGRFVIYLADEALGSGATVQRLRLTEGDVDAVVQDVRELVRDRGRTNATWEVAASATPDGLAEALLEFGMTIEEPLVVGMAHHGPIAAAGTPGTVARCVASVDELVLATRVQYEAFGMTHEVDAATCALRFANEGALGSTYIALIEGEVVAAGYASYTPFGVLLFGGATGSQARGRGAYRALVQARHDDAVSRGTPTLVTHASPMSRPILSGLGFEEISTLTFLRDELG